MISILFSLFVFTNSSLAADKVEPLGDNVLFAFDKCKVLYIDQQKPIIKTVDGPGFDIHCKESFGPKTQFKCDFFDTQSNKKTAQEALQGGRTDKVAQLTNAGGTRIDLSLKEGTAAYTSPLNNSWGTRVCAGIFIFEKEALKRKK